MKDWYTVFGLPAGDRSNIELDLGDLSESKRDIGGVVVTW